MVIKLPKCLSPFLAFVYIDVLIAYTKFVSLLCKTPKTESGLKLKRVVEEILFMLKTGHLALL